MHCIDLCLECGRAANEGVATSIAVSSETVNSVCSVVPYLTLITFVQMYKLELDLKSVIVTSNCIYGCDISVDNTIALGSS